MKKIAATALLTALCALSTAASATQLALNGSMGTTSMSTSTYNATFSGKSLLPQDYTINSLTFSFSFMDDGSDTWTTSSPSVTSVSTGNYYSDGFLTQTRDRTVNQTVNTTSEQESATLSLAGIQVGSGATTLKETISAPVLSSTTTTLDKTSCFILCTYYYTDTNTYTTTDTKDWTGPFTISGTVTNQQILDKLLADDMLAVSLNVKGDLKLTAANILLDYTKVESNKVPEPSSLMLAAGGLFGLGYARRRAARAQK